MINLCLSAPPLTNATLEKSRAYLFLLPSNAETTKETIIGAIVLTRIDEAMRVAKSEHKPKSTDLVLIDSGLYCYPEKVPALMGVSRLFVSISHRRKGIAASLLSAGAKTFVRGCPLRVEDGVIAFSQPTSSGRMFMDAFGGGSICIYEE
jgi:N-acetyltransferase